MFFSQRKGLKPSKKLLQTDSIDAELRNRLWSCLSDSLFKKFEGREDYIHGRSLNVNGSNLEALLRHFWFAFLKEPTDSMPENINQVYGVLRKYFFECEWNEAYDFIEFSLRYCPDRYEGELRACLHDVLEQENAGYRIVGLNVAEITSEEELSEVDAALKTPIKGARAHLESAIGLLSQRKNPDYRNSIKESISAVEAICRSLTSDPKATLGAALNLLQGRVGLHKALKSAFSSLYGYTSDEQGIRHAMLEEPTLTFSDAKFMLVACSAFVNYVVGKASEAGLRLK